MCFLSTIFPNAPAHTPPLPILFDQSLKLKLTYWCIFTLFVDLYVSLCLLAKYRSKLPGESFDSY